MNHVQPMGPLEIRQTVAALASCMPADHAAYIRSLPQDEFATVAAGYVAARSSNAPVPPALLERIQAEITEQPVAS